MKHILSIIIIFVTITVKSQCVKSFVSGAGHSALIKSDGTLWAWGRNTNGQLGNGTTQLQALPIQIGNESNWKSVSAVHAYSNTTIVLKEDNTLWSMGQNDYGQTGIGTLGNILVPTMIPGGSWKSCKLSHEHALAVKLDGTLWAWGRNNAGQLGDGSQINHPTPIQIGSDNNWKEVTAGSWFSLAIKNDGTLWGWGSNSMHAIGFVSYVPMQIGTSNNWESIDAGNHFVVAKQVNGSIWSWGHPTNGATGQNTQNYVTVPTQIGSDSDWSSISAAAYRTFAIRNDGTLWGCGHNFDGQLGDGTTISHEVLTPINDDNNWQQISPGAVQTLAMKSNGSIWIWGGNSQGNLGNGTFIDNYTPNLFLSCSLNVDENQNSVYSQCTSILNLSSQYISLNIADGRSQQAILYDMSGKAISKTINNQQVYIGDLERGIYIIRFECNEQVYYRKFIKK